MPKLKDLAECQSIALEMGECLEGLGEIAAPSVRLLEDYCECLYKQSVHLDNNAACRQISKKIQKQLGELSRKIRFELPEGKREILFLPYKASMWDSLESVWTAAREREDSSALVMPIPYYDKNPDGSFGELHDEKDQYPDDVPVVDWQEYSIPDRCPDIIYIHNPYDQTNHVTSVHPAFYAKELKKYTDMLVYIPYFLSVNGKVAEHLCVCPGTIYADRVIVESEEVKRQYLEAFRREEKENGCPGLFGDLEQKLLALGTPKLDRIRKVGREEILVPKEWERVIVAEGGIRRKVILYNTSLDAFLQYSGRALEKIERTLESFKKHSEVALLWRPHPLLEAAIRSTRASLYPEYCRMVQKYQEEGWGIYDDTADVERAIALSDAYYGDWSSVVSLCQAAGKPVMIQSYEKDW